jgi:hypothetical protein
LKGSGMRWVEEGAATVAALRALYVSSSKLWDGFWAQPHRPAAWKVTQVKDAHPNVLGVQLLLGWEIRVAVIGWRDGGKSTPVFHNWSWAMVTPPLPPAANETREQRIEAIMKVLRPKIEQTVRQMVERAVDVPEAEEFGAIDFEFRDAGQQLANEVRQASVASRKKRAT